MSRLVYVSSSTYKELPGSWRPGRIWEERICALAGWIQLCLGWAVKVASCQWPLSGSTAVGARQKEDEKTWCKRDQTTENGASVWASLASAPPLLLFLLSLLHVTQGPDSILTPAIHAWFMLPCSSIMISLTRSYRKPLWQSLRYGHRKVRCAEGLTLQPPFLPCLSPVSHFSGIARKQAPWSRFSVAVSSWSHFFLDTTRITKHETRQTKHQKAD